MNFGATQSVAADAGRTSRCFLVAMGPARLRYANMRAEGKAMASKRPARSLTRKLIAYCAVATLSLFGRLPAQDFQYTIANDPGCGLGTC